MELQVEPLARTMQEASIWCESRRDENNYSVIRSSELNPGQTLTCSANPCGLVDEVCATRSRLLKDYDYRIAAEPREGRLLLYYPNLTLSDGTAELVSRGFFDADNEPAWDVWVFCDRDESVPIDYGVYLLSWIPNRVVDLVEQGIHFNPERCLEWATESKHPFAAKLRRCGLLS